MYLALHSFYGPNFFERIEIFSGGIEVEHGLKMG